MYCVVYSVGWNHYLLDISIHTPTQHRHHYSVGFVLYWIVCWWKDWHQKLYVHHSQHC